MSDMEQVSDVVWERQQFEGTSTIGGVRQAKLLLLGPALHSVRELANCW
jgi:hypothetical protein